MLENTILILIALIVLLFVALLWLRYSLLHSLSLVKQNEQIIQKDFDKRRDVVPYLLESVRQLAEPTDHWRRLLENRSQFHESSQGLAMSKELEFEKNILTYIQNASLRSVNFLDAKKDIEELSKIIEKDKVNFRDSVLYFNEKQKTFPYSFAAKLFGFKELSF